MNKAISMSLVAVVLLLGAPVRADFNDNDSISGEAKAEQAAAEMRSLVENEGGDLSYIKEVSVEKDFWGRPRLKLLADRPETKVKRDKFEPAVDWQFSCDSSWHCDPDERPMMRFGIGYRIVYEKNKRLGLENIFGRTQYRPAMLAYFNWLVGKVRENGALSAGTWSIQNNVLLKGSGGDIMFEKLLLAGSHVDENPSAPDVLSVREELHNSDFDSIESATITRKEETGILGLGRREVITEETDTWILYHGSGTDFRREYRTKKRVKIDANSGEELEDKSRSIP